MLSAKYAMCVALDDFFASTSEEVDAVRDDILEVIGNVDSNWLIVRNTTMRSRVGNQYGIIPKGWVAMLSADGTSWFTKHKELPVCARHQKVTRRQKTPPPLYEDAINEEQEDDSIVTRPIELSVEIADGPVDLLATENVEEVNQSREGVEGFLWCHRSGSGHAQQAYFTLSSGHRFQSNEHPTIGLDGKSYINGPDETRFVLTTTGQVLLFEARSRAEAWKWVNALRFSISCFGVLAQPPKLPWLPVDDALEQLRMLPSNNLCADCSAPNPNTASLGFGVLVCQRCAEIHATMPCTRIQNLSAPPIRSASARCLQCTLKVLLSTGGNGQQGRLFPTDSSISPHATRLDRARFIHGKYAVERQDRFESINDDLRRTFEILQTCNINSRHSLTHSTMLHVAVRQNLVEQAALLMFAGADPRLVDDQQLTPLDLALKAGLDDIAEVIVREYQAAQ